MTPDDTRKQDPGVAKSQAAAQAFRQLTSQDTPFQQLHNFNPYWQQQNLGMTTQVLPGVAGAQTFNAQALTQTLPDLYMSTHRQ